MRARSCAAARSRRTAVLTLGAALAVILAGTLVLLYYARSPEGTPVQPTAAAMLESDGYRLVGIYDRHWFSDHDGPDLVPYLADGPGAAALGNASDGSSEIVLRLRDARSVRALRAQLARIVREVGSGATGYIEGPYLVLDLAPLPASPGP